MRKNAFGILVTLLVCCLVSQTTRAADQPVNNTGKSVYDMANRDFRATTLNPNDNYRFTISWDNGPVVSINGTRVENVVVTYDEESISLVGRIPGDGTLMAAEFFVSNDNLTFRASDIEGHNGVQYSMIRGSPISRAICSCVGSNVGVTTTTACTNAMCDNVDTCRSNGGGAVLASCKWLAGNAREASQNTISLRDVFAD